MSMCATISLGVDQFRLAETLRERPQIRVEFERIVPLENRPLPSLWVTGVDTATGLDQLRTDSDVAEATVVAETPTGLLAGIDWREPHLLVDSLAAANATCLQGFGTADGWQLSLRFPSRSDLADCYQQCARGGVSVTVDRIQTTSWSAESGHEPVLTETQRETLTTALQAGYFAVPRTATLQDLAEEFEVSDTAISQRLRRGIARLLQAELSTA